MHKLRSSHLESRCWRVCVRGMRERMAAPTRLGSCPVKLRKQIILYISVSLAEVRHHQLFGLSAAVRMLMWSLSWECRVMGSVKACHTVRTNWQNVMPFPRSREERQHLTRRRLTKRVMWLHGFTPPGPDCREPSGTDQSLE